jgi:hypothetical protein
MNGHRNGKDYEVQASKRLRQAPVVAKERFNQPKRRSTTQRHDNSTKPFACANLIT